MKEIVDCQLIKMKDTYQLKVDDDHVYDFAGVHVFFEWFEELFADLPDDRKRQEEE